LTFRYQCLHNDGFKSICRALQQNDTLLKLTVACDMFWDAAPIACALIKNVTLNYLNIGQNDIGDSGAALLGQALSINKTLQTLILDNNSIFNALPFCNGLRTNTGLRTLSLWANYVGDDGIVEFAMALHHNRTLQSACLHDTNFKVSGAHALCEALKVNESLLTLDIGNNEFGSDGAEFIAIGLENNRSLQALDMSTNCISEEGALCMGKALSKNESLQELFLGDNFICHGSINLANALKTNKSLHTLILCCNRIKDDGAESFSEALKINSTLVILNLGRNEITEVGAEKLANALMTNSVLKSLDLQRNWLDPVRNAALFTETLIVNKTLQVTLWVNHDLSYSWPTMNDAWTY
jgi:Ran GTPase-activating protein (RanGAP) involved in mRNA processing and transport